MSTLQTISSSDTLNPTSLSKINSNFSTLNADKLEASDISGKQDTLVSGTNIKTINGVSVLGSGGITIPALTDGDKGDISLTSSGTVWTIDNNVVTNAKLGTTATNTIKGRSTAGTGNVEDLTPAQLWGMLPVPQYPTFYGCRVTNSANQTLSPDSLLTPVWDTESYDSGGFHTGSNNYFTIPVTGYYLFNLNLNIDDTGNYSLYITKNSDSSGLMSCNPGYTGNASFSDGVSLSGMMKCTAGDTVNAFVHLAGTSGNPRTLLATNSFFSISLLGV